MQLIVRSINSGSSELLRKASFIGDSIAALGTVEQFRDERK
jgi:hypothetical protein